MISRYISFLIFFTLISLLSRAEDGSRLWMRFSDTKQKENSILSSDGVLGGNISKYLAQQGAKMVIMGRSQDKGTSFISEINANGGEALFVKSDVMDEGELIESREKILTMYGKLHILINAAEGNVPGATLAPDQDFHTIQTADWEKVIGLNMNGTVYPSLIFSKIMAEQGCGCIINISSMAAYSSISRVPGYSAAKAAISNYNRRSAACRWRI